MNFFQKLKTIIFGNPLNPMNPNIMQHVSLVAFLAWVGLGADGLSSSCYGPEGAYLALGVHTHFALYIAIATAITVFLISMSYNQVIELFPSGGGGYKVATQLLGSHVGLVSGSALVVDYALTIAISIASGMDAIFSMLPVHYSDHKLMAEMFCIGFLILLNLRGTKESITLLIPIVLGFFVLHIGLILYGILAHYQGLTLVIPATLAETQNTLNEIGWIPVLALILHAYSLGGGTYTGIETVSNNVNKLREPRVATGKWTMLYMAISLSCIASGVILLYLLWDAQPVHGQTLNAVVFHSILGDTQMGKWMLLLTLSLEGGLLLIAGNSGFLAGPSVLANMAIDGWMPTRFRHLSNRLVIQNGVIVYGLMALAILAWCQGRVALLVVLYSINVFVTFTLSLSGMCIYWITRREKASPKWIFRLLLSFVSLIITSSILCITLITKFGSGGWLTVVITCAVILLCLFIKNYYYRFNQKLALIDLQLKQPVTKIPQKLELDIHQPTAVILVGTSTGVAMHSLLNVIRLFPNHFKNFIFISAGMVDVESFAGQKELSLMREKVDEILEYFVDYCEQYGLPAEGFSSFGTDTVAEITNLSRVVSHKYPNCIFFSSKIIFKYDNFLLRLLHNETALTVQRNLHLEGKELVILPMNV